MSLVIVDYTPSWVVRFNDERTALLSALGSCEFAIEHIGSTAVPGLAAKPSIDVMLGASSLERIEEVIAPLASLGFQYMPGHEKKIPERRLFAKPAEHPRSVNLHGVVRNGRLWRDQLAFRDALRSDSSLARTYEVLKRSLAAAHPEDRAAYTEGKSNFVRTILAQRREA